jgi:hypothetical protein
VTVHENRDGVASNFLAAEIAAFTTQWCYARITPAALHRGSFAKRGDENGEAVGCRSEFQSFDFSRLIGYAPRRITYSRCMARC